MQTTTMLTLIIAALVLALIGLAVYTRHSAGSARANGYDQGYDDAKRAHDERIAALHEDIEHLHRTRTNLVAEHRLERDAIIQDCDARIAVFARRSNPFTEPDLHNLETAAQQLDLLSRTFSGLGAVNKATTASQAAQKTLNMAERLRATLIAQEENSLEAAA